jgi:3-phenylpropionate/trans-cinnamate dioxygenase ferredoxin subunit
MMAVQMATRPIPRCFRVKAYPVNVEPGTAVVKGPYIAETIKVAVESDYVVVGL